MKELIKKSIHFLVIFLLFTTLTTTLIYVNGKIDLQLIANRYHVAFLDYFFFYFTKIIESPVLLIFALIFLFKNAKYGIIGILTYAIVGGIASLLKLYVFGNALRPTSLIKGLRLIPEHFELEQLSSLSFPSGHTTAGFTIFLVLTLIVKNKNWGYFFGICAVLVAYSRVYLSQHFFEDILAGGIIGVFGTLIVFYLLDKIKFGDWAQKPLIRYLNKK